MPWLALPYNSPKRSSLAAKFNVQGIPLLVVLDGKTGDVVDLNGRQQVGTYLPKYESNDIGCCQS